MAAPQQSTVSGSLQFCALALPPIRSSGLRLLRKRYLRISRLTLIILLRRELRRPAFISMPLGPSFAHVSPPPCICRYGIIFNSSFNNEIHRSQVNSAVGDIIRSFSVNHKVDLDSPDVFILVDTYKSAISVGISRNYKK